MRVMRIQGLAAGYEVALAKLIERTKRGGYKRTIEYWKKQTAPLNWMHDAVEMIGGISFSETVRGLEYNGEIVPTQRGVDVMKLIRRGHLNGVSVEFPEPTYEMLKDPKYGIIRVFDQVLVYRLAVVDLPAEHACRIERWWMEGNDEDERPSAAISIPIGIAKPAPGAQTAMVHARPFTTINAQIEMGKLQMQAWALRSPNFAYKLRVMRFNAMAKRAGRPVLPLR